MATNFHGLPTRVLANDHLRVEFLAEAGPRIVRLSLAGSPENQLAEVPHLVEETPYGVFSILGGHRLWHAPEAFPRSYIPDNQGMTVEEFAGGARLLGPIEQPTRLRKTIELRLHPDRPALTLRHTLFNAGLWPIEVAPWAITQLPLGGAALLPQQAPVPSPYLPNRQLTIWPYSQWHDPRLRLYDDYILIAGSVREPPLKIGYFNHRGWLGYLRGGFLFLKRFEPQADQPHPDMGCNTEVFCYNRFIELETLAPQRRLDPDREAEHIETWELHRVDLAPTIESARALAAKFGL